MTAGTVDFSSAGRPCLGEAVSGDAVVLSPQDGGLFLTIVDVLGHGTEAALLARNIEEFLERHPDSDVSAGIKRLHQKLRGSRGAAAGLCYLDTVTGRASYTAVGNTVIRRIGEGAGERRLVSQDGVLGQNMRTPLVQHLQLEAGDTLLLYTDGISDRFVPADYPGLGFHDAATVAKNVVQRFGKQYDDAACIAVRYGT